MTDSVTDPRLHRRLIGALYVEAMVMADEARSYFDEGGRQERDALDPRTRVTFSCESLKVTTRLMHVIAWLLTQRAVEAGELSTPDALHPSRRLGASPNTNIEVRDAMPDQARSLIKASVALHQRVAKLEAAMLRSDDMFSPARSMQARLSGAFLS